MVTKNPSPQTQQVQGPCSCLPAKTPQQPCPILGKSSEALLGKAIFMGWGMFPQEQGWKRTQKTEDDPLTTDFKIRPK